MRAVQFDYADATFPVSLIELDEPVLPGPGWARLDVSTGGICGSDLHLFTHTTGRTTTGGSPTLASIGRIPFVLGHEISGRVTETGPECDWALGTRVAVDPCIPCTARSIDPPCANCARGWSSSCLNLDSRVVSTGRTLGYTQNLGGGWADQVLAHTSMLHAIPDSVSERGSSLFEPLSIACHGLLRSPPETGASVLVVGAGIIGLATVAALRGLYPDSPVTVLARYQHQADAATACGAAHVVTSSDPPEIFEQLSQITGDRIVGRKNDLMLLGGFPYVVEAVGAPETVTEALRAVAHRGTVLMLGVAGISEVDLTPIWYKEAALVGSIDHCLDTGTAPGTGGGPSRHSIDRALDILTAGLLPDDLVVTHEFPLDGYRDAIETALDRSRTHAIKVVFHP
jgi:threonine dehydrogenase-like Zn-dependent dehydrogenase